MIYFDNASTTFHKPEEVYKSCELALRQFTNLNRGTYKESIDATRMIVNTKMLLSKILYLKNPLNIAFTSSATESLNLVIGSLIEEKDHVITTVLDHNAVLRPLYLSKCELSIVNCDEKGEINYSDMEALIKENTKAIICTHASNVLGNIIDIERIAQICKKNNIIFILDASQTLGQIDVNYSCTDVVCFTAHKGLYGIQGVGGIAVFNENLPFKIVKTGGTGSNSFAHLQSNKMPELFEVGTQNVVGIYALHESLSFILKESINEIYEKEKKLVKMFVNGIKDIENIIIYTGHEIYMEEDLRKVAIASINFNWCESDELAQMLYNDYKIATRSQNHCAPLIHENLQTKKTGMVRFSFSYFNTETEVQIAINSLKEIAANNK